MGMPGEKLGAIGLFRFGVFEVDVRTGEVRKHGIRIKLADQPFRVLVALIEKPGELVTRDELQQRIWSNHTFVDFEQGLNRSVNKVREALGDSAANSRFVETLPGRGYRFIIQVEGNGGAWRQCASQCAAVTRSSLEGNSRHAYAGAGRGSQFFGTPHRDRFNVVGSRRAEGPYVSMDEADNG